MPDIRSAKKTTQAIQVILNEFFKSLFFFRFSFHENFFQIIRVERLYITGKFLSLLLLSVSCRFPRVYKNRRRYFTIQYFRLLQFRLSKVYNDHQMEFSPIVIIRRTIEFKSRKCTFNSLKFLTILALYPDILQMKRIYIIYHRLTYK